MIQNGIVVSCPHWNTGDGIGQVSFRKQGPGIDYIWILYSGVWEHKTGSLALPTLIHAPGSGEDRHARMVIIVMKMVKLKGYLRIPALFPILLLISTATLLLPSSEAAAAVAGFTVSSRHLLRNDDGVHFVYTCIAYCSTLACCYSLDECQFWGFDRFGNEIQ